MGACTSSGSRKPVCPCVSKLPRSRQPTSIDRSNLIITHSGMMMGDVYDLGVDQIGEGSFSSVRQCTRKSTKAVYAVKEISKTRMRPERLMQEVANMRLMDHPNIIKLFEVFEESRQVHLVMELCTGGELFHHLVEQGHFHESEAVIAMEQILRAVHYMHQFDICHRDLKPENFIFKTNGTLENNVLKLIDFGFSCKSKPGTTLRTIVGTPTFIAPQVLAGRYDRRCDLWSCGVILYTLLCGNPPFYGHNSEAILAKVQLGWYTFDSKIWQQVSQDAKFLIRKLMALNPDQRYTAEQALGHPWVRLKAQIGQSKMQMFPNLLQGLRAFQSMTRLKKAVLHVITKQMSDEQTKGARDMFLSLDTDSDGTLSLAELRTGLAVAGLAEAAPDIEEIVEGLDTDGNGTVDYTEFIAAALDQETYLKEDLCWTAFNVFDLDGDGRITRHDLQEMLGNGNVEHGATGPQEELLRDLDGVGGGSIDFEEFMIMMATGSAGLHAS